MNTKPSPQTIARRKRAMKNHGLRMSVLKIKQLLDTLPDELEVEFSPISGAWLGTMHPMRAKDIAFYNSAGDACLPSDPDAHAVIDLHEEAEPDDD